MTPTGTDSQTLAESASSWPELPWDVWQPTISTPAPVGPDRRQGPDGARAAAQPLVARAVVRDAARADDLNDPAR